MKNLELQLSTRFYTIVDPFIFILCAANLALWINRILYVRQDKVHWLLDYLATDCLPAMKIALYIIPLIVLLSAINRPFVLNSFTTLSIKCTLITLFLIYIIH